MFCQLQNGLKIVFIKQCYRSTCLCFFKFEEHIKKSNGMPIESKKYERYICCYDESISKKNPNLMVKSAYFF